MAYTKSNRAAITAQPINQSVGVYDSTAKTYTDTLYQNIYAYNGTLSANRTITTGGFSTTWDGTGDIVFADSGNITTAGDIAVNGGDITTTATTFNLVNTTATTLNVGGAATTVSIGSSTGTTTINTANTVITGNLTVNGTTTTVESTTVSIADKNFELAKNSVTDAASDGGGITLKGTTDKTFNWVDATDAWTSSENLLERH
jgi:hypothetical protein